MAFDSSDHLEGDGQNVEPVRDLELDLFNASKQNVIAVNPMASTVEPPPEPQSLEELLYFWFGFCLDETLHEPMPSSSSHNSKHFNTWAKICQSVGGQTFESSTVTSNFELIQQFLVSLEAAGPQPLHAVPAKFWDLSPWNRNCLSKSPSNLCVEIKHFEDMMWCLLHLHDEDTTMSWTVAVSLMTALECICWKLGPCHNDIVDYLITHGMEFCTLQAVEILPPPIPALQPLLRYRPDGYVFDQADFLAYESAWDAFLQLHPYAHRALCEGGIIAHLARESMPNTLVFQGPLEEALEGRCGIFASPDGIMVDDHLPEDVKDFICGMHLMRSRTGCKFHWCCPVFFNSDCCSCLPRANLLVPEGQYMEQHRLQCWALEWGMWRLVSYMTSSNPQLTLTTSQHDRLVHSLC